MHLYQNKSHSVLIIGLGLVGKAISIEMAKKFTLVETKKLKWSSLDSCTETVNQIINSDHLTQELKKLTIIWSAGKTGFQATEEDINHDLSFFKELNNCLGIHVRNRFPDSTVVYQLISSAGGLFEGQVAINAESKHQPLRPYGILKLEQENYISSLDWINQHSSIRLSSVYTISNFSGRLGLIPTIMKQAVKQKEVSVYGSESTLRDYVLDEDIARFVISQLEKEELAKEVFLVNGKPSSIQEIKIMIERIIGRKIYLKYNLQQTNSKHISFLPNIKPKGFNTSGLNANLRLLYNKISFN